MDPENDRIVGADREKREIYEKDSASGALSCLIDDSGVRSVLYLMVVLSGARADSSKVSFAEALLPVVTYCLGTIPGRFGR
jgi:hypothetical protein